MPVRKPTKKALAARRDTRMELEAALYALSQAKVSLAKAGSGEPFRTTPDHPPQPSALVPCSPTLTAKVITRKNIKKALDLMELTLKYVVKVLDKIYPR